MRYSIDATLKRLKPIKNDLLFSFALLLALWCAVAGIFWIYWFALYAAYPFGVVSFLIWKNIKKDGRKRNRIIPIVLASGLWLSLGELIWMYVHRSIVP